MTEAEWASSRDPEAMLRFLGPRASTRKQQLFAVACCRRATPLGITPAHRAVIDAAELVAEGLLDEDEFEARRLAVRELLHREPDGDHWTPPCCMSKATLHARGGGAEIYAARFVAAGLGRLAGPDESPEYREAYWAECAAQCDLLRDIFGDPSRPFRFDTAWLAGAGRGAVDRAREIEQAGRFDDLSSLADELERAGCDDRAVLDHCRGPGPHVRGCWVVDALLSRECAVREGPAMAADWEACEDPLLLTHALRDKGTDRHWRNLAVACCRRIDDWITDPRSRRAVDVAERYADGRATEEELDAARAEAQHARDEAKRAEYEAEAEENFCLTPRYAAVSREFFAAEAARSAVARDPRRTDAEPGTYEAERWRPSHAWAVAAVHYHALAVLPDDDEDEPAPARLELTEHGKLDSIPQRPGVEAAAEEARRDERRAQCAIARDIFGEFLGPPGAEGDWLPLEVAGFSPIFWKRPATAWCRLPTTRRVVVRPEWLAWSDGLVPRLAREIDNAGAFDRLHALADALQAAGCDEPAILDHLRGPGPHVRGCWVLDLLTSRRPLAAPGSTP